VQCLTGLAAGAIDQPSRKALGIIEQNLEQVFGGKLLVAFAQSQRLGGLHEPARTVGELLEIHYLNSLGP
jgi:hypothetical protein